MFCSNCGKQIEDGAGFCPFCGAAQNTQQQYTQQAGQWSNQQYQQAGQQYQNPRSGGVNDTGNFLWAIPGALIPLAGIIIFFVIRKEKPKSAKMAIIGAAIGVVLYLLLAGGGY